MLCAAQPLQAPAEVAARLPRSLPFLLEHLGGQTLRETEAVLNGGPATVRVLGFPRGARGLARELAQALQLPAAAAPQPAASFWLEAPAPGGATSRVIVLPGGDTTALAFLLELPPGQPPGAPAWPWNDLPPPPAFEPGFTAAIEGGRIALVTGTLPLPGAPARRALADALAAAGWSCATPAAERLATVLHARRGETLLATTLPAADGAPGTRVALLRHRPR